MRDAMNPYAQNRETTSTSASHEVEFQRLSSSIGGFESAAHPPGPSSSFDVAGGEGGGTSRPATTAFPPRSPTSPSSAALMSSSCALDGNATFASRNICPYRFPSSSRCMTSVASGFSGHGANESLTARSESPNTISRPSHASTWCLLQSCPHERSPIRPDLWRMETFAQYTGRDELDALGLLLEAGLSEEDEA